MHLEKINDQNNAEILQNNEALKGLKEYYDSLSTEEQEYFYEYLSEYYSYVDTMNDKAGIQEIEIAREDLDSAIETADRYTSDVLGEEIDNYYPSDVVE